MIFNVSSFIVVIHRKLHLCFSTTGEFFLAFLLVLTTVGARWIVATISVVVVTTNIIIVVVIDSAASTIRT